MMVCPKTNKLWRVWPSKGKLHKLPGRKTHLCAALKVGWSVYPQNRLWRPKASVRGPGLRPRVRRRIATCDGAAWALGASGSPVSRNRDFG